MAGKLFGIGVGPGDPELMTLKAVRILKECDVLAVPGRNKEDTVAYKIAYPAVPEIADKEWVGIYMPMTKEKDLLEKSHTEGAKSIEDLLKQGKNVAYITLGDPTVYATYMYVHKKIQELGYETELVSGIPSFCAAAARMGNSLGEKDEQIHIIPSSYEVEEASNLPGTKVFMKAASKMGYLKEILQKKAGDIFMVENCTMENEKVFLGAENIKEDAGYYSIVVMKEK